MFIRQPINNPRVLSTWTPGCDVAETTLSLKFGQNVPPLDYYGPNFFSGDKDNVPEIA